MKPGRSVAKRYICYTLNRHSSNQICPNNRKDPDKWKKVDGSNGKDFLSFHHMKHLSHPYIKYQTCIDTFKAITPLQQLNIKLKTSVVLHCYKTNSFVDEVHKCFEHLTRVVLVAFVV